MKRFKSFSRKGATALKSFLGALLLGGLLAVQAPGAQATLIGQTVGCATSTDSPITYLNCSNETAVIQSPGTEFTVSSVFVSSSGEVRETSRFTLDIDDHSILIETLGVNFFSLGRELSVSLSDLFWLGNPDAVITGFDLSVSGVTGFDDADISFSDNAIEFVLGGRAVWSPGSSATIDLITGDRPTLAVSEPATLALFGLGLAGLGLMGRRKARQPLSSR